MYRSLNAKALGIRENERITVLFSNGGWQVRRASGEANPLISHQVLSCLRYSPDLDRYFISGPVTRSGAVFVVRH
jgi:hypothetical protein